MPRNRGVPVWSVSMRTRLTACHEAEGGGNPTGRAQGVGIQRANQAGQNGKVGKSTCSSRPGYEG